MRRSPTAAEDLVYNGAGDPECLPLEPSLRRVCSRRYLACARPTLPLFRRAVRQGEVVYMLICLMVYLRCSASIGLGFELPGHWEHAEVAGMEKCW
jgi:hypothetical protein